MVLNMTTNNALGLLISLLMIVPRLVAAVCECGYVVDNAKQGADPWLFTDYIESNFHQVKSIARDSDWRRQQFNVTAESGRGEYGKAFMPGNIDIANPPKTSTNGDDLMTGLELRVGSKVVNGAVPVAELDSSRNDLYYGSYRAGMKMTDVNGTCAAFFWYFNDTQEIDMEFLSREFDKKTNNFPVNLVIQSKAAEAAGFNAEGTDTFKRVNLTFDPTEGFHEYRFDFLPDRVLFYADSELLADMGGNAIPTSSGHLILQHWSNGNVGWSGGPPTEDAVLTVSYVKAYFNTTDTKRQTSWAKRCDAAKDKATGKCVVQGITASNASTGGDFLGGNNPKAGGGDGNGAVRLDQKWATIVSVLLLVLSTGLL
ncbi:hypothetical protein PT974_10255 [Cladobotryum mycophilum]|uniref:GH16 domain-containing protein n=1 Tax=Cladobotryum mycophilum TaxID=491253 RepID=A0ABR0S9E1_9HYPO